MSTQLKSPIVLLRGFGPGNAKFYVKHYDKEQRKYITIHTGHVPINGYRTIVVKP